MNKEYCKSPGSSAHIGGKRQISLSLPWGNIDGNINYNKRIALIIKHCGEPNRQLPLLPGLNRMDQKNIIGNENIRNLRHKEYEPFPLRTQPTTPDSSVCSSPALSKIDLTDLQQRPQDHLEKTSSLSTLHPFLRTPAPQP